jgi:hypothetical protein
MLITGTKSHVMRNVMLYDRLLLSITEEMLGDMSH